jgi:Poly(ADP-ribose) polymerase catalytic domain
MLFGHRKSDGWQRNIETMASTTDLAIAAADLSLVDLRSYTDAYLNKKGKMTAQDRDTKLAALIRARAGSMRTTALMACAHAMSPQAVRALLISDFAVEPGSSFGLQEYLKAIIAARTANHEAVSGDEELCAKALIESSTAAPDQRLETLTGLLTTVTMSNDMLLKEHLTAVLRTTCSSFADHLYRLKVQNDWLAAYLPATRLRPLLQRLFDLGRSELHNLLDELIVHWHAWALWQPNIRRLHLWEAFSDVQRKALQNLLALEGPDFSRFGKSTMREGLLDLTTELEPARLYNIAPGITIDSRGGEEPGNILDRVVKAIDNACRGDRGNIALLIQILVNHAINGHRLHIFETVSGFGDPRATNAATHLLQIEEEPGSVEINVLLPLLAALEPTHSRPLRDLFGHAVANCIKQSLKEKQDHLSRVLLTRQRWTGTEKELLAFGADIRGCKWIHLYLENDLRQLLRMWPASQDLDMLASIRESACEAGVALLPAIIDAYCLQLLIGHDSIDTSTIQLLQLLMKLWQQTQNEDRRTVMLLTTEFPETAGTAFRQRCLIQIRILSEAFIDKLVQILRRRNQFDESDDDDAAAPQACISFTKLLSDTPLLEVIDCWRPILRRMIEEEGTELIEQSLSELMPTHWLSWVGELTVIFSDELDLDHRGFQVSSPAMLLQPRIHNWAQQLSLRYGSIIGNLEWELPRGTMKCILLGGDESLAQGLETLLQIIRSRDGDRHSTVLMSVMALLARDGTNILEISETMSKVALATDEGLEACENIFDFHQKANRIVTEAVLNGWLSVQAMTEDDQRALQNVAALLDLMPTTRDDFEDSDMYGSGVSPIPGTSPPVSLETQLDAIEDYVQEKVNALLEEAERLDALRLALKVYDADGVHTILESLGIEDSSPVDDALVTLPVALVDVVERISDREVELQFPLTNFTALQRTATAIGDAQSLLVRLVLGDESLPNAFCLHLDTVAPDYNEVTHDHWFMLNDSEAPNINYCEARANRTTYQLSRVLYRHIQSQSGALSIPDVYATITSALQTLASNCIVCGFPQTGSDRLRRSILCSNHECAQHFSHACIEVRLSDIRQDPAVVDLLLTAVYISAAGGNLTYLANCPITMSTEVTRMLNALPSVAQMQSVHDPASSLSSLGTFPTSMDTFLTWILTSYRGFLISATGQFRIPSMPGVHQFVLANAAPEQESAFNGHLVRGAGTKVLFHGTTLDRLYSILTQGLRVLSNTAGAQHGASHGRGVYMAREPAMSYGYMNHTAVASWANSAFSNIGLLLGCEYAGNDGDGRMGFQVVTDPTMLMVRYVFLVPLGSQAPLRQHIETAMMSAFAMLRY